MCAINILSIDGGGMRGILPAMILQALEAQANRRIADIFDFFAGTSTGGIIVLGLTAPNRNGNPKYTAREILEIYQKNGGKIFSRTIFNRIRSLDFLIDERYPAKGIEGVLKNYFKDTRLKEALKPVFVTSYEIEERTPFFFRSERAIGDPEYDYPMWQVARATSAAPTYFEPLKIPTAQKYWALIDGGVYVNNPTMCAIVEALKDKNNASLRVLSLGTGSVKTPIRYDDAKDWGGLKWVRKILSVSFNGVSDTVNEQAKSTINAIGNNSEYFRIDCDLAPELENLDNATASNIRALTAVAETLVSDNLATIKHIAKNW